MLGNSRQVSRMGRKLRFIQQNITDLCKRLDDLKEELTRASVEDQELFLSEIKNVKEALDDDLAEVYIRQEVITLASFVELNAGVSNVDFIQSHERPKSFSVNLPPDFRKSATLLLAKVGSVDEFHLLFGNLEDVAIKDGWDRFRLLHGWIRFSSLCLREFGCKAFDMFAMFLVLVPSVIGRLKTICEAVSSQSSGNLVRGLVNIDRPGLVLHGVDQTTPKYSWICIPPFTKINYAE